MGKKKRRGNAVRSGQQFGMRPMAPGHFPYRPPTRGMFRGSFPARTQFPPPYRFRPPPHGMMHAVGGDPFFDHQPYGHDDYAQRFDEDETNFQNYCNNSLDFSGPPLHVMRPRGSKVRAPKRHYSNVGDRPPEVRQRPPDVPQHEFPPQTPLNDNPGVNPSFVQEELRKEPHVQAAAEAHDQPVFKDGGEFHTTPQNPCPPGPEQPPAEMSSVPKLPDPKTISPAPSPAPPKLDAALMETKAEEKVFFNPPRGRSVGVISYVAGNCGYIERDDLKKFSFMFAAFHGFRSHLIPGVKVHFTVVKNLGKDCATDVKVVPGGLDEVDSSVFEGVVVTPLPYDSVIEHPTGWIKCIISTDPIKLKFGKTDSSVTLLQYDRVNFQLLTNLLTKERRATNIKPKLPDTFQLTKEFREQGVILSKKEGALTISTSKHGHLPASASDRLSDEELLVMDRVELTIVVINDIKTAIRLKKLSQEPEIINQQEKGTESASTKIDLPIIEKWKPVNNVAECNDSIVSYNVSTEKFEGVIVRTAPKESQQQSMETNEAGGLLTMTVGSVVTKITFKAKDVITTATLMVHDKVKFNILTSNVTKQQKAVNVEIMMETFQMDSVEQRKTGFIFKLEEHFGLIKTQLNPPLFFAFSELLDDVKLSLSEKVEFTLAPKGADEHQAVRIRRLKESIFTSTNKLEALGTKEKKMTIKLKVSEREELKANDEDGESQLNEEMASDLSPFHNPEETEDQNIQEQPKVKRDGQRSRDRAHRRDSRSRSLSRSRSRSRERSSRHRSGFSRESREGRYKYRNSRSRSRERFRRYRQSRSRSRERSSQSHRRRSPSPESSNKRRAQNPEKIESEISKRMKELMELNEMIARKKAIVALEQIPKPVESEGDKNQEVKMIDYQHARQDIVWTPVLKPVKSILKKQPDPQSQGIINKEMVPLKSESLETQKGNHETESVHDSDKNFTTTVSGKIQSAPIPDMEWLRQKNQLDKLSESVARERAIIALAQKARGVQVGIQLEKDYELECTDDQDGNSDGDLWKSDPTKSVFSPKKSILKRRSDDQSDAIAESFAPETIRPDVLGFLNRKMEESSRPLQLSEHLNLEPVIPQSVMQASSTRFSPGQKLSSSSKARSPPDTSQHRTNNPSTSQTSSSDQKKNIMTQMERFLSALNKADTNTVNSLFQEARKDMALIHSQKFSQKSEISIPLLGEPYDPFLEEDDEEEQSAQMPGQSLTSKEALSDDSCQDDLLPHERAVQDGSGFSCLVSLKRANRADVKAQKRNPYGQPVVLEDWSSHDDDSSSLSAQWNREADLYSAYQDEDEDIDSDACRKRSLSVEVHSSKPVYGRDKRIPDSAVGSGLACLDSKELVMPSEVQASKSEHFEKFQSLLQTVGLHLDTAEVSKLEDRTQERLYGKMRKDHSAASDRESLVSRAGHTRGDSSDSEISLRSVSPFQSSNRKVFMSYKESVEYEDQLKAQGINLSKLKRTIKNIRAKGAPQNLPKLSSNLAAPTPLEPVLTAFEHPGSQFTQSSAIPTIGSQHFQGLPNYWGPTAPSAGAQNINQQYPVYPYGQMPPAQNLVYLGGIQPIAPHVMPNYSLCSAQVPDPYCRPYPPFHAQNTYGIMSAPVSIPQMHYDTKVGKGFRFLKTIQTVSDDKTESGKSVVNVKPKVDRKACRSEKEGWMKVTPTITEDDIKAKQKKRLELFNQRMKLKKEQQMEAQRTHGQRRNSATGKPPPTEIKNVWICGHSLVFWAEKRATSPEFGMQLGMHPDSVRIWWKGTQGMTWHQLLPLLLQLKDNWPKPDVLVIHLGGNDISTTSAEEFIQTVAKDLTSLKSIFPECRLVWSDILSRQSWRGTTDNSQIHLTRKAINDAVHHILAQLGGSFVTHDNIKPKAGLYRPDGVHLSGKGIDTFNLNLQDFLEKWESENEAEAEMPTQSLGL